MKRSLQEDKKKQVDDKGNIKQSAPPEGTTETRQFKQRKQEHQLLQQQEQEQQKRKEELETQRIRERMHRDVVAYKSRIRYSEIYKDEEYQYRHVTLPPQIAQYLPDKNLKILLRESEYRRLGVNISSGWEHYMIYQPEPNILLLKRSIEFAKKLDEEYRRQIDQKRLQEKEAVKNGTAPPPPITTTRRKVGRTTRLTTSTAPSMKPKPQAD